MFIFDITRIFANNLTNNVYYLYWVFTVFLVHHLKKGVYKMICVMILPTALNLDKYVKKKKNYYSLHVSFLTYFLFNAHSFNF